jgi:hypothetical protein
MKKSGSKSAFNDAYNFATRNREQPEPYIPRTNAEIEAGCFAYILVAFVFVVIVVIAILIR